MDTEFDRRCVHGILPLVTGPEGLRFAVPGKDAGEDCVGSPGELPDAELQIRVFQDAPSRNGWAAAAREFGGNAVSVATWSSTDKLHLALCVRHDRSRAPGETLEDAVQLLGGTDARAVDAAALRLSASEARARVRAAVQERGDAAAWRERWKAELRLFEGRLADRTGINPSANAPLSFEIWGADVFSTWTGQLFKDGQGVRARVFAGQVSRRVERRWTDAAAALGWSAGPGYIERTWTSFGAESARELVETYDALRPTMLKIAEQGRCEDLVAEIALKEDLVKTAAKIAAGYPVACGGFGLPMFQASPRTGTPQTVPGSRVLQMVRNGLAKPLYWTNQWKGEGHPTVSGLAVCIFGLTETGTAMARGDHTAAARTIRADQEAAKAWMVPSHGGTAPPDPHFDAVSESADPACRETMRDNVGKLLAALSRKPGRGSEMAVIAALLCAGAVEFRDGKFRRRDDVPASDPAP